VNVITGFTPGFVEEVRARKAMLGNGWRNDAIHYYFSRPDRLISSGRIAQIEAGKYGAAVEEAQPEDLDGSFQADGLGDDTSSAPAKSQAQAGCRHRQRCYRVSNS
jgi:hypothetical protein